MKKVSLPLKYIEGCEENQKRFGYPECILDCEFPKSIKRELKCRAKSRLARKYRKERIELKKWET